MSAEIWKPIPGYGGKYEASSFGNIRSWATDGPQATRRDAPRVLTPQVKTKRKFLMVHLSDGPKASWHTVHALVLAAHIGPRPGKMKACHNDGNCQNNRLENLRWDTQSANMIDAILAGTLTQSATLTPAQVLEIAESNLHPNQLAERYGVKAPAIYNIKSGRRWAWLTKLPLRSRK